MTFRNADVSILLQKVEHPAIQGILNLDLGYFFIGTMKKREDICSLKIRCGTFQVGMG